MQNMNFFDERLWVAIAFLIFITLFCKKFFPVIIKILDKRSDDIKLEIENASNLLREAQDKLYLHQNKRDNIKQDIIQITQKANDIAASILEESRIRLRNSLEIKEQAMNEKIIQQENAMKEQIFKNLVDDVFTKIELIIINNNKNLSNSWLLIFDSELKHFMKNNYRD